MVTFQDKTGRYQLPTGWHEVSTRQYCELDRAQCRTVEQRASFFAGRPIQVNGLVADALAWCLQPVPVGQRGSTFPLDLGQETFLQVELIRELLLKQPLHECFGQVYGIFTARMRNYNMPVFQQAVANRLAEGAMAEHPRGSFAFGLWAITETYPAVAHCLAELQRLNAAFAALAEPDETETGRRARQAGSERLAVFSHLNVARHYAERFGKTIDEVYQWPWQQVMLFLLQDKMTAEITDKLYQQRDQ